MTNEVVEEKQEMNQIENLVAGFIMPNLENFINFGVMRPEEYNTFIENMNEEALPEDVTIKFIEDEVPEEIDTPNYVAFYLTQTGAVIVEANYEYIVSILATKISPEMFESEEGIGNLIKEMHDTEDDEIKGVILYLNQLSEVVEENKVFKTFVCFNNMSNVRNITIDKNREYPAFPVSFSKIYKLFAHPDIRIRTNDGEWKVVTKDMTANEFASNLELTPNEEAFVLPIALR